MGTCRFLGGRRWFYKKSSDWTRDAITADQRKAATNNRQARVSTSKLPKHEMKGPRWTSSTPRSAYPTFLQAQSAYDTEKQLVILMHSTRSSPIPTIRVTLSNTIPLANSPELSGPLDGPQSYVTSFRIVILAETIAKPSP